MMIIEFKPKNAPASLSWALHQMRLRRQVRDFNLTLEGRVSERTRIARDLHDTLLQSFQAVVLHLQAGVNMLPDRSDLDGARKKLESVVDMAEKAIAEGRDTVQDLRSSRAATNGLAASLCTLADGLTANESNENAPGVKVEVEGEQRELHPIVCNEVYRISAEALRNALRHAHATGIEVEIRYDDQRLSLRIRDDGKGIDQQILADKARAGHYGFRGMHERAKRVGGNLEVWSRPDAGTEIHLTIPASTAYSKGVQGKSVNS